MRKHVSWLVGLIVGILISMTYQTPKDSISTFSRSLTQFGIHPPHWLQDPITDRVVRISGAVVVAYCVLHLLIGAVFSIRRKWKNREPKYPSPFADGRGRELIGSMHGNYASIKDGIVELREGDKIITTEFFSAPIAFRIRAKTNSTNVRLSYAEKELIFNWEYKFGTLRIDGGPLHNTEVPGAGQIPMDVMVTIDLIYFADSMRIDVAGCNRFHKKANFSSIKQPFSVFSGSHSTVHVESVLAGIPKPLTQTSIPDNPQQPLAWLSGDGSKEDLTKDQTDKPFNPKDIVYAEYGNAKAGFNLWANTNRTGAMLAEYLRDDLFKRTDPIRLTNDLLKVPPPPDNGLHQTLRFRLRNGKCFELYEYAPITIDAAAKSSPF